MSEINEILGALHSLTDEDLAGNLIIIEPGIIRLRKQTH